jgi:hypothetical protein
MFHLWFAGQARGGKSKTFAEREERGKMDPGDQLEQGCGSCNPRRALGGFREQRPEHVSDLLADLRAKILRLERA